MMLISTLLNSCATDAARWPRLESRFSCSSARSVSLRRVTSRAMPTVPIDSPPLAMAGVVGGDDAAARMNDPLRVAAKPVLVLEFAAVRHRLLQCLAQFRDVVTIDDHQPFLELQRPGAVAKAEKTEQLARADDPIRLQV